MQRQEAIDALGEYRGDTISVATMQAAAPWKDAGQAQKDHVDASDCMGSAASLGLGLAVGAPDRKIMVLDGDGSLLMQLGSLVTIASLAPSNYYHFIFYNGLYQSSGNQTIPGYGKMDFCQLALAAGYRKVWKVSSKGEFLEVLPEIMESQGPVLIEIEIEREEGPTRFPGVPVAPQIKALRANFT